MSDLDMDQRISSNPDRRGPPVRARLGLSILTLFAVIFAGAAAAFADAPGPRPSPGADHEIVARVNGDPVTRTQFDRMVANPLTLQQAQRELGVEEPGRKELERLAMQRLIHLRLLVQEAGRRNITVTREELDEAITALVRRFDSLKEFGEWVKGQGLNDPDLFETVRTDMLAERATVALAEGVSITEKQARVYYEAHKDDLVIGAEVQLRIIAVDSKTKAEEILAALRKGASFNRLARERSQGKLAARGGETGWVGFHRLPPFLQEAVASLSEGDVAGPVERSADEFLLIGLQASRPLGAKSFAEARTEIERRLLAEKRGVVVREWLEKQEKKASIEIHARPAPSANGMAKTKGGPGNHGKKR